MVLMAAQLPDSTINKLCARYILSMNRQLSPKHTAAALTAAIIMIFIPGIARAWDTSLYTSSSRLSTGRWMKVSIESDGLYQISASTLRSWGFGDASKVRVYGYGGRRQSDVLSTATYRDDLPEVQCVTSNGGIIFYGIGAGEWVRDSQGEYYRQNDYSESGYYFIGVSDSISARTIEPVEAAPGNISTATTFTERVQHELEQVTSPGEAGPVLLGEEFRYTNSRTFALRAPGAVPGDARIICSFVSNLSGNGGQLRFTVDGDALDAVSADRIPAKSNSSYIHGVHTRTAHTFEWSPGTSGNCTIGIQFTANGACLGAWLNYLTLNYTRSLAIPAEGYLTFYTSQRGVSISGAAEGARLWDVTDPMNIRELNGTSSSGTLSAAVRGTGNREFVVWNPGARLPSPKAAGFVNNQNLHGDRGYDMVIVSPSAFIEQAERLADLHRLSEDSLKVKTVTPEQIYNEFSSGAADPGGIRRYFKMLYDTGSENGRPLRYAILMGRTTVDNRGLSVSAPNYPTLPSWMPSEPRASLSDNDGYCSDDLTAMLADGSGANPAVDKLSIALGRIPVVNITEARNIVDKAIQYAEGARKTAWKHRFMFLADDQDNGRHLQQTETMIEGCLSTERQQHIIRKVYMDAYELQGNIIPGAREAMFRYLNEGVVWWNFIGHANTTGWTHENQLSYSDLNNMYLRHWPFIYAATCDFMRLDGNDITGGEILYKERYGGAIGIISAVRPVYISNNGWLSAAMGRALALRDDKGRFLPPGDIYRIAKNDIRDKDLNPLSDDNRLRYVFIGDPALRLATPSNIVRLDSIEGKAVNPDNMPVMAALAKVPVSGSVTDPEGNVLENFNGTALIEIFDSERSVTTLGHGEKGTQETFEDYGERIYYGAAEVRSGRFCLSVNMPSELSQNYRPATMSLYAYSTEDDTEAVGISRDFYVYGYDESAPTDDTAPDIESFVLNHSTFRSGDTVNPSPMIIASVRDDVGINVSSAGIGHQMTATLDGRKTYTDLSFYYTPSDDGTPSGVINYPLEDLQTGNHTLSLRIWDTAGNSATKEIEFFVQENLAPKIYDVYTDANPASTTANFYLSHDQPDNMVTVNVTVYNLLGRPVWSGSSTGRSDMFQSVPVSWNLTDEGGRRVPRGIYLYRATITADNETFKTASRRIAVTAQ